MTRLRLVNTGAVMGTTVTVYEAKTRLSRLLDEVAAGAEVVIAKAGKPVARIVPIEAAPRPKHPGLLGRRIRVPDDFNAALAPEDLADFEDR